MGVQIANVWHFDLPYTYNTAFKPALGELYKKHSVCTKFRLYLRSKIEKFFWGGRAPPHTSPPRSLRPSILAVELGVPRVLFRKRSLLSFISFWFRLDCLRGSWTWTGHSE